MKRFFKKNSETAEETSFSKSEVELKEKNTKEIKTDVHSSKYSNSKKSDFTTKEKNQGEKQHRKPPIDVIGNLWTVDSLYHGSVFGVQWNTPNHEKINYELDAAVGSNQEEALAALISAEVAEDNNLDSTTQSKYEKFFVGFVHDLLGEMETADGQYKLEQETHRQTFHSVDAGILFDYIKPEMNSSTPKKKVNISNLEQTASSTITKNEKYAARGKEISLNSREIRQISGPAYSGRKPVSVPQFTREDNPRLVTEETLPTEQIPPEKVTMFGAPRYYETKDPVLLLSYERNSTKPALEGHYDPLGRTRVRTRETVLRWIRAKYEKYQPISTLATSKSWLPQEIDVLIDEHRLLNYLYHTIDREQYDALYSGTFENTYPPNMVSHVCLNFWKRQAWLPIAVDVAFKYYAEEQFWKLDDVDFSRTAGKERIADFSQEPIVIRQRIPISKSAGNIAATQISRFLEDENELDESQEGVLSTLEEAIFTKLKSDLSTRDLLSATLDGLDDFINSIESNDAIRAGLIEIDQLNLIDAFGQVEEINPTGLFKSNAGQPRVNVGLSLQNENDDYGKIVYRPRIPKPARLDFRLLSNSTDDEPATGNSSAIDSTAEAKSPVCGYLLPDHIEWAMEVFDSSGNACGQLRVAERDWSLGGIQKGRLAWDSSPGSSSPAGALPESGNLHLDRLLNSLMNIGMIDDLEQGQSSTGEGVLSALLRAIDTTYWHADPFGKGGGSHPSFYMGRPVAVVRAKIRLQIEGGENNMSEELRNHKFQVKLGSITKSIDGLLGYFVNDDYTRFNAVYPLNENREPIQPSSHSLDHDFLIFDPTLDVHAETDIFLTLLLNPQSSIHITTGILPQKEITLLREHWEDAVARIAPTFKVGPVLVNPDSIRMPVDDGIPNLSWTWVHRETPSEWVEAEIKRSDSLAGLPHGKMKAYEGWMKLDIIE